MTDEVLDFGGLASTMMVRETFVFVEWAHRQGGTKIKSALDQPTVMFFCLY